MANDIDDDAIIAEIVERLSARFPSAPPESVRAAVTEAYDGLRDAHVRDFVAVLAEKQAKKRLKRFEE